MNTSFLRGRRSKRTWYLPFAFALVGVLEGLQAAVTAASAQPAAASLSATAAAWAKLLHLLPVLLLSKDGRKSRAERFALFTAGDLSALLTSELRYSETRAKAPRQHPTEPKLMRDAVKAAHQARGGCKRAARMLAGGVDAFAPNTPATLDVLRSKHPAGDDVAVLSEAAAAARGVAQARLVGSRRGGAAVHRRRRSC